MRVGLSNIDPKIAEAIAERLCGPIDEFLGDDIRWEKQKGLRLPGASSNERRLRHPSANERYVYKLRKKRDALVRHRVWMTLLLPLLAGGGASFIAFLFNPIPPIIVLVGAVTWLIGLSAGVWWTRQAQPRRLLDYELTLEELEVVLPMLSLTRAERVYCDNLLLTARMEANLEARRTIRRTIGQLNELLSASRVLDQRRQSLLPVLGTNPVKELEVEVETLKGRLNQATDGVTRESIERSLQLVESRLQNAHTFEQALVRLNAQQEALVNALSMAQSALARMQVAPSVETDMASKEITDTVIEMNRQTYSVEQAVEEVMLLRG